MRTFTIDLEDAKKADALKKFLEAFEIPFKDTLHKKRKAKATRESSYNPEFVEKIQKARRGRSVPMTMDEFQKRFLS